MANVNLFAKNVTLQHQFHVVPDEFNIPVDAIIGRDFIHKYVCDILHSKSLFVISNRVSIPLHFSIDTHIYIPPRAEVIRRFEIDFDGDCVIDNMEISDGIFISRTIVNPKHAHIRVLNTTDNYVKISNKLTHFEPLKNFNIYCIDETNKSDLRDKLLVDILSKNNNCNNCYPFAKHIQTFLP